MSSHYVNSPRLTIVFKQPLKVVLVINGKPAGSPLPYNFLTVLNLFPKGTTAEQANTTLAAYANTPISNVRGIIDAYATTGARGSFVMSNTVYATTTSEECATLIGNKIFTTSTDAEKQENGIDVYVERVISKVRIAQAANLTTTGTELTLTDGTTETTKIVKPVIQGIGLANEISHSYLFKSIVGYDDATRPWSAWSNWTDSDNKRSYWATTPAKTNDNKDITYSTGSYNDIDKTDLTTTQVDFYTRENTSGTNTAVIAVAEMQDNNGDAVAFCKWGSVYCTLADYPTLIANHLKTTSYLVKYTNADNQPAYRNIAPTDLKAITDRNTLKDQNFDQWEICCQLNLAEGTSIVEKTAENTYPDRTETFDAYLMTKNLRAWYWNDGKAYYYVPIEHFGTIDPFKVGVVRNHIYDITINSISGLGTPVFDPDEDIIPDYPGGNDMFYYLGARINILSWKVVKQQVNFGPQN